MKNKVTYQLMRRNGVWVVISYDENLEAYGVEKAFKELSHATDYLLKRLNETSGETGASRLDLLPRC